MRYNEIIIKRKMTPDGAASRNANSGIGKSFLPNLHGLAKFQDILIYVPVHSAGGGMPSINYGRNTGNTEADKSILSSGGAQTRQVQSAKKEKPAD